MIFSTGFLCSITGQVWKKNENQNQKQNPHGVEGLAEPIFGNRIKHVTWTKHKLM